MHDFPAARKAGDHLPPRPREECGRSHLALVAGVPKKAADIETLLVHAAGRVQVQVLPEEVQRSHG